MNIGGFSWMMITVVGVAILAIVLAYAKLRNRADAPPLGPTEAATRRVYEEEEEAHRGESDDVV
jgi:mannose/fructose/N-acetylgalactosamine-specific phosphotransferase system component IIC